MTEQAPSGLPHEVTSDLVRESEAVLDGAATADQVSATGVPVVDQVLADVDQVDGLPLEQHQEAFERAHATLRSALDAGPDDPA